MNTIPFNTDDVIAAFPKESIHSTPLGYGSFKVAYLCNTPTKRVLKIVYSVKIPSEQTLDDFFEASSSEEMSARIQREILAMGSLRSQNIVQILGEPTIATVNGERYIAYWEPFYPGGTLEERIKDGKYSEALALEVAKSLLEASKIMNAANIVHRDIKPANIAFDEKGSPVLLDLGIALHSDLSPLTSTGMQSPKTIRYAAPEQWDISRDVKIDARTDQYAIGLTCYEAATGEHIFFEDGDTFNSYLEKMKTFSSIDENKIKDNKLRKALERFLAPQKSRRFRNPEKALKELS